MREAYFIEEEKKWLSAQKTTTAKVGATSMSRSPQREISLRINSLDPRARNESLSLNHQPTQNVDGSVVANINTNESSLSAQLENLDSQMKEVSIMQHNLRMERDL